MIDNNYRTNDPSIYAAGTLTKYSRKYLANHLSHKYFSRSEIGEHLGQKIKEMILPEEVRYFSNHVLKVLRRNMPYQRKGIQTSLCCLM